MVKQFAFLTLYPFKRIYFHFGVDILMEIGIFKTNSSYLYSLRTVNVHVTLADGNFAPMQE